MKHALFVLAGTAALTCTAQDEDAFGVQVHGRIADTDTTAALPPASVVVSSMPYIRDTVPADSAGGYAFALPYDAVFTLEYAAPGHVSKRFVIDTRDIPEKAQDAGFDMEVDVSLFARRPGQDYALLEQPFGYARFDPVEENIAWDHALTVRMQDSVDVLLADGARTPGAGKALKAVLAGIWPWVALAVLAALGALVFLFRPRRRMRSSDHSSPPPIQ